MSKKFKDFIADNIIVDEEAESYNLKEDGSFVKENKHASRMKAALVNGGVIMTVLNFLAMFVMMAFGYKVEHTPTKTKHSALGQPRVK